jgi:glycerol uptake facilitator-like aquaporin
VVSNEALGMKLASSAAAEAAGTALLLAAMVGTGIMAERLNGNGPIVLLAFALMVGFTLAAIIACFGPISGGHFNPVVTLVDAWMGGTPWSAAPVYIVAQLVGAFIGVGAANLMYGLPAYTMSHTFRGGIGQDLGEFIATFGLLAVILGCVRAKSSVLPLAVGIYLSAAIFFTSSTAFANPAVTLGRAFTNTFSGIQPSCTLAFIIAQILGAAAAGGLFMFLGRQTARS